MKKEEGFDVSANTLTSSSFRGDNRGGEGGLLNELKRKAQNIGNLFSPKKASNNNNNSYNNSLNNSID